MSRGEGTTWTLWSWLAACQTTEHKGNLDLCLLDWKIIFTYLQMGAFFNMKIRLSRWKSDFFNSESQNFNLNIACLQRPSDGPRLLVLGTQQLTDNESTASIFLLSNPTKFFTSRDIVPLRRTYGKPQMVCGITATMGKKSLSKTLLSPRQLG